MNTIDPQNNDTICAISTAPGIGGIAVARISGPRAIEITDTIWHGARRLAQVASHTAHLGTVDDSRGDTLDQCVATVFRGPRSFTGEDVIEISVHGSRYVQRELLDALMSAGCRLAQPGEFTRRAFTAGKMDLAEAEAVADVIASDSRAAHRIAISQMRGRYSEKLTSLRTQLIDLAALLELELDFSEEDVEFASRQTLRDTATQIHAEVTRMARSFASGTAIKEGIPVAIVGPTNAGKSSLLNALLGDDRAIVSDIRGTTRDTIEETLEVGDYLFRFIDTAGLRHTTDDIERQGIDRSRRALSRARIVILVIDPAETAAARAEATAIVMDTAAAQPADSRPYIVAGINKADIADPTAARQDLRDAGIGDIVALSAKTGHGIDRLLDTLSRIGDQENGAADEGLLVTNARHAEALRRAARSTARVIEGIDLALSGDLIAQDLRETIHHLASITGDITSTDILSTIFSRFCIGK